MLPVGGEPWARLSEASRWFARRKSRGELDLPNLDFIRAGDRRDDSEFDAAVFITSELMDHLDPGAEVERVKVPA